MSGRTRWNRRPGKPGWAAFPRPAHGTRRRSWIWRFFRRIKARPAPVVFGALVQERRVQAHDGGFLNTNSWEMVTGPFASNARFTWKARLHRRPRGSPDAIVILAVPIVTLKKCDRDASGQNLTPAAQFDVGAHRYGYITVLGDASPKVVYPLRARLLSIGALHLQNSQKRTCEAKGFSK